MERAALYVYYYNASRIKVGSDVSIVCISQLVSVIFALEDVHDLQSELGGMINVGNRSRYIDLLNMLLTTENSFPHGMHRKATLAYTGSKSRPPPVVKPKPLL